MNTIEKNSKQLCIVCNENEASFICYECTPAHLTGGLLGALERIQEFIDEVLPEGSRGSRLLSDSRIAVEALLQAAQDVELTCVRHDGNDAECFKRLHAAICLAKGVEP